MLSYGHYELRVRDKEEPECVNMDEWERTAAEVEMHSAPASASSAGPAASQGAAPEGPSPSADSSGHWWDKGRRGYSPKTPQSRDSPAGHALGSGLGSTSRPGNWDTASDPAQAALQPEDAGCPLAPAPEGEYSPDSGYPPALPGDVQPGGPGTYHGQALPVHRRPRKQTPPPPADERPEVLELRKQIRELSVEAASPNLTADVRSQLRGAMIQASKELVEIESRKYYLEREAAASGSKGGSKAVKGKQKGSSSGRGPMTGSRSQGQGKASSSAAKASAPEQAPLSEGDLRDHDKVFSADLGEPVERHKKQKFPVDTVHAMALEPPCASQAPGQPVSAEERQATREALMKRIQQGREKQSKMYIPPKVVPFKQRDALAPSADPKGEGSGDPSGPGPAAT